MFAHTPEEEKIKRLSDNLLSMSKGVIFGTLLKGNNYKPCTFFDTSIKQYTIDKQNVFK